MEAAQTSYHSLTLRVGSVFLPMLPSWSACTASTFVTQRVSFRCLSSAKRDLCLLVSPLTSLASIVRPTPLNLAPFWDPLC